jgi:hypothetical protein
MVPSRVSWGSRLRSLRPYAVVLAEWKLIHNTVRPDGKPEFELFHQLEDPLDRVNVADQHPDVVDATASTPPLFAISPRHTLSKRHRISGRQYSVEGLSEEELRKLRSLGYIQ